MAKRGRPKNTCKGELLGVRLPPDELANLNAWIAERGSELNRQTALRIRAGLKAERAPAGPPERPNGLPPGLVWRRLKRGWVAYWYADAAKVIAGFRPAMQRLWGPGDKPDWELIDYQMTRLRLDMLESDRVRRGLLAIRKPSQRQHRDSLVSQNRLQAAGTGRTPRKPTSRLP